MTRVDELARALARAGIQGRQRDRILLEAEDHLTEGDPERFGDPEEIAQRFADELATAGSTRTAFLAFGALAVAGLAFGAGWLLIPAAGGWPDLFSTGWWWPLAIVSSLGMLICPQVAFAAGLLALLRARRLRGERAAPAAQVAVLLNRTGAALLFGAGAMVSQALFAVESRGELASWYTLGVGPGAAALAVPLVVLGVRVRQLTRLRPAVPGGAGDLFDDLPVRLPRRPWLACFALTAFVAFVTLGASGGDEGPRNAVAEAVLVIGCFAALGRRLGIRR